MRDPINARTWRVLSRLIPAWYRDRYATELLALHAQRAGRSEGFRFWYSVSVDVLQTAIQLRLDRPTPDTRTPIPDTRQRQTMHATRMAIRGLRKSPGFTV